MLNRKCGRTTLKKRLISALAIILVLNLLGCQQSKLPEPSTPNRSAPQPKTPMAEVSPPRAIQLLHSSLDVYQPQVSILSPKPDQLLEDNTIDVQVQVQDLPLFQDETLGLGPHLQLILDNQPLENIYSLDEPITLSDLEAGTHTLRIFAAYPWEESFKNDGAYAQTTFHIFTKTPENNPNSQLPQLTYNQPRGTYGAEPVLLDFYLANAPLHLVAQENPEDEIVDWRIRVTLNGESFIIDQWQPIYIEGVKPGKNWVQLEYLDELGEPLTNVYNNTARVFTYNPNSQDTVSQLVRGELSIAQARPIVDPGYDYDATIITPEVEEIPEPEEPITPVELTPEVEEIPEPEEPITPVELTPEVEEIPEPEELIIPEIEETLEPEELITPEVEETPEPEEPITPVELTPEIEETLETEESDIPTEVETVPVAEEQAETIEPEAETEDIEVVPKTNISPTVEETSETRVEEVLAVEEEPEPLPQTEETDLIIPVPVETKTEPESESTPQTNEWFNQIKSKVQQLQNQIQQLPILQRNNSETSSASISSKAESSEKPSDTNNFFQGIVNRFQQIPLFQQKTSEPEPVETLPEIVDEVPVPEATQPIEPEESPELFDPEELEPTSEIQATQTTSETVEPEAKPETLPEMEDETSIVEPDNPSEEPVVISPEAEPETLPEMEDETPIVEPNNLSEETLGITPKAKL